MGCEPILPSSLKEHDSTTFIYLQTKEKSKMSPTNLLNRSVKGGATLLGAVGLGAIAFLGAPQSASANVVCGLNQGIPPAVGPNWVSVCPPGVDVFPKSWAILDIWLLNPDGTMGPQFPNLMFMGPATITRDQGSNGTISTRINETLVADIPGFGPVTLTGNGTGAIEDPDGDGMANSFFDVLAQIQTPLGLWTAQNPITVTGDRLLKGVSPDMLPPADRTYNPNYSGALNCPELNSKYPANNQKEVAIAYKGCIPVTLFDAQGMPRAILHSEIHIVHPSPIPEPSATVPLALLGLAGIWGLKKKHSSKQD
jgi:hypothetical protein